MVGASPCSAWRATSPARGASSRWMLLARPARGCPTCSPTRSRARARRTAPSWNAPIRCSANPTPPSIPRRVALDTHPGSPIANWATISRHPTATSVTGATIVAHLRSAGYDFGELLRALSAPTLVLHGEQDALPAAVALELSQLLPRARLALLPDAGHMPFWETPERFFTLVGDFLDAPSTDRRDRKPDAAPFPPPGRLPGPPSPHLDSASPVPVLPTDARTWRVAAQWNGPSHLAPPSVSARRRRYGAGSSRVATVPTSARCSPSVTVRSRAGPTGTASRSASGSSRRPTSPTGVDAYADGVRDAVPATGTRSTSRCASPSRSDSADADVHVTFIDHFDEPISGRTKWARDDDWWITDADIVLAVHHRNGGRARRRRHAARWRCTRSATCSASITPRTRRASWRRRSACATCRPPIAPRCACSTRSRREASASSPSRRARPHGRSSSRLAASSPSARRDDHASRAARVSERRRARDTVLTDDDIAHGVVRNGARPRRPAPDTPARPSCAAASTTWRPAPTSTTSSPSRTARSIAGPSSTTDALRVYVEPTSPLAGMEPALSADRARRVRRVERGRLSRCASPSSTTPRRADITIRWMRSLSRRATASASASRSASRRSEFLDRARERRRRQSRQRRPARSRRAWSAASCATRSATRSASTTPTIRRASCTARPRRAIDRRVGSRDAATALPRARPDRLRDTPRSTGTLLASLPCTTHARAEWPRHGTTTGATTTSVRRRHHRRRPRRPEREHLARRAISTASSSSTPATRATGKRAASTAFSAMPGIRPAELRGRGRDEARAARRRARRRASARRVALHDEEPSSSRSPTATTRRARRLLLAIGLQGRLARHPRTRARLRRQRARLPRLRRPRVRRQEGRRHRQRPEGGRAWRSTSRRGRATSSSAPTASPPSSIFRSTARSSTR